MTIWTTINIFSTLTVIPIIKAMLVFSKVILTGEMDLSPKVWWWTWIIECPIWIVIKQICLVRVAYQIIITLYLIRIVVCLVSIPWICLIILIQIIWAWIIFWTCRRSQIFPTWTILTCQCMSPDSIRCSTGLLPRTVAKRLLLRSACLFNLSLMLFRESQVS